MASSKKIPVWLDCDPGHDDAFAICMAAYSDEIHLLGISIVNGNDRVENCRKNALRFLWACGVNGIEVYSGVEQPLIQPPKYCPEIHGIEGEDGVAGMCGYKFPDHVIFPDGEIPPDGNGILKMREKIMGSREKVTVVLTGAHTNMGLLLRVFPEVKDNIREVVFMGGAIGLGNTGVAAEFNIEIDPEASYILLHSGLKITMVPLEVTHFNLVTPDILRHISQIEKHSGIFLQNCNFSNEKSQNSHPHHEYEEIFKRIESKVQNYIKVQESEEIDTSNSSEFAKCCVKLLTFFKGTYAKVFSFSDPPLHDPCALFHVISPTSFQSVEMHVDVETSGGKSMGRTLCDVHGLMEKSPNVRVCTRMNGNDFWRQFFKCLYLAAKASPLI